jgi:hypothetical protein
MWIFFIVVMLSTGDPLYVEYGKGPGHPHEFSTLAECEIVATKKMAEYNAHPIGVMMEHGCAKLKPDDSKWDA